MTADPRHRPVDHAAEDLEPRLVAEVRSVEPLALRAPEAARLLGISVRALWTLTRRGDVPVARLGRSVIYPLDELRAWLKRKAHAAKATPRSRGRRELGADSVAD